MGKGQNKTGGKKGKRAGGGKKKYGANIKDIFDITPEQRLAELIKHYGGTPPRFKGVILSPKHNGKEVRVVKPGSTRARIQLGDVALIERNIANSISSNKQEYHILIILRKDQIRQLKQKGLIIRYEKSKYDDTSDIEFDADGVEEEVLPQQRRYSISSDSDQELINLINEEEKTNDSNESISHKIESINIDSKTKKETEIKNIKSDNSNDIFNEDKDEIKSFRKNKNGEIIEIDTSEEITNLISHTPPLLSDKEKRQLKKIRRKSPVVKNIN